MVRRVVTAKDTSGKSVFAHDDTMENVAYEHTPGFGHRVIWTTSAPPVATGDIPDVPVSFVPGPGGTVALTVTFPPDSVFMSSDFDPSKAVAENLERVPGLAELFEPDAPGMHTTPTVDYVVVLEGPVVLELDDGEATTLQAGDVVVQNAARHAWRVPSDRAATIFVVLMGQGR